VSNLKVDTISSNATGSVTFQSQARLTQGAVVTGTLTASGGLTAAGIISSSTEIEGAALDINGNGDVSGQLTCGSLITDGAVSANSMYVQGVQLQPHIFAFTSFDGSALNSAKNLEAFTDDGSGNITFEFTDAPDDSSYVVIATNLGGTGGTLSVGSKTTASFTVQGVGGNGCDVLVLDQLIDETIDALAPPLIALDDLSDVVITNPIAKQILYYNGTQWRNVGLSATDIASGTFDNARIAQANVTQHESALSIDGTQLTNLSSVNLSEFNNDLGGTSDHGTLAGLGDDDHTQYALADGTRGNFAASSHTHDAGDITSGIFSILRIPDLSTSKITSGTFADARISSSSVTQHAGDINLLDLGNVTGTIYGTGSGIYYNGTNWVAGSLTAGQIPSLDASKITTGTFADARISESSVTQHEAALAIAASQLTSGSLSIDLTPSADLTYSIGTESARWLDIHGDLDGAVTFRAKNASGVTLTVGDIVYISGVSGSTPTVDLADCSDPAKMPAFGMVRDASVNPNAETHIATLGSVESVDVPSGTYTLGSNVYVGTAGTFTDSPPAGEGNLIQNIGWVARVNSGGGSNGIIKVGGAGRTNAVPNLNQDKIFLGNASNQAVPTALSSINLSKFNNDLPAVSDSYAMFIETPSDKSYTVDPYAPAARTVTRLTAKTSSGTCNVLLANGGLSQAVLAVSSAQSTTTTIANASVTSGDRLTITVSSTSGAVDLEIAVEYTQ